MSAAETATVAATVGASVAATEMSLGVAARQTSALSDSSRQFAVPACLNSLGNAAFCIKCKASSLFIHRVLKNVDVEDAMTLLWGQPVAGDEFRLGCLGISSAASVLPPPVPSQGYFRFLFTKQFIEDRVSKKRPGLYLNYPTIVVHSALIPDSRLKAKQKTSDITQRSQTRNTIFNPFISCSGGLETRL